MNFPEKCSHHLPSKLDYLAWHEWAETRTKAGEKQVRCPKCRYWFFPEELGKEKP